MRIGVETLSCNDRTGIGKIVRALSRAFVARGHEVHIVTRDPGQSDGCITVHRAIGFPRSKALSKVLFRMQDERVLRRLKCDVTYSFGVGRGADVIAAQSCHRAGIELLQPFHLDSWDKPNWGLYDMVSLSDEKALLTSRKTRRIIACSYLVKNQIVQQYGVEPGRIEVIPNGVTLHNVALSRSAKGALRKQWGISEGEKVLLFVGNEFARKGLQTVLEAMARLAMSDVRLFVAGAGAIEPFERLSAALQLTERVTFLGSVEKPERLFAVADLFVFPTLYDPCPLVVLEAMAAGVPVITAMSCGAVEGLTHGTHGIYLQDPRSAGELADWVRTLLSNDSLCQTLALEGRRRAMEMSWDAIAERTLSVLEEVHTEKNRV